MGSYVPSTGSQRQEMLKAIGLNQIDELFQAVPQNMLLNKLDIPEGKSELEVRCTMEEIAAKNQVFSSIFLGAGAYNHYIPAIVKSVTGKEEFITAYTPYQAEISQGILQSIFEFQTMICDLTGMDAANASVYDGAAAAAEATTMCKERKRTKTLVSAAAHPMTIETIKTYCKFADTEVVMIPAKEGVTDFEALKNLLDDTTAGVYLQQPNFYGQFEDAKAIGEAIHAAGGKFIMGVNPIACAIMASPAECGADVAVGEGQPLGMPLGFGGPYLGFMACTKPMLRKLPGRIVGETVDHEGNRGFVLTLQAREQHIRREKASSNICSNQAHCALTASVYLAAMGNAGLKETANQCLAKAHYAAKAISQVAGFQQKYTGEFFHEFVTNCPIPPTELITKLAEKGILGGYPLADGVLWCVTEMNTKAQIDNLVATLREVCA